MERSSPKGLRKLLRLGYWVVPLLASAALTIALGAGRAEILSPGPLSRGHALLGDECGRCHTVAFGGLSALANAEGATAMNAACLDCHGHRIAADPIMPSVGHGHEKSIDAKLACSGCHLEHRGATDSRTVDDAPCTRCHREAPKPIASFGDADTPLSHPDFRPERDPGTIRFNHRLHTGGAPGAVRQVSLACSECHKAEARDGAYQAPIEYARHCERCHQIKAAVVGRGDIPVPHEAPALVHADLANALSTSSAGGDETSATRAASAESSLYTGQAGCAKCHRVVSGPGADGASPSLATSSIPARWYTRARFDHGQHTAIAFRGGGTGADASCAFCHSTALASTQSADIAVPGKEVCRQCHGSDRSVSGRCVTCHTFHVAPAVGATAYEKLDPALIAEGERETRFGMRASKGLWPRSAFDSLPTAVWGVALTPGTEPFEREVLRRYGLFRADFPNDGLPLGLLKVAAKDASNEAGITVTCDLCHSSSLLGRIVPGQPNRFCDIEQLWIDLSKASGDRETDPLYFKTPHRNTLVNGADQLGLLGMMMRKADLSTDVTTTLRIATYQASDLKPEFDAIAYVKTPPWYVYRTKQSGAAGYYFDGGHPKDGNFAAFTYLVSFWDDLRRALVAWQRSGHTYLASLSPPRYPFAIDQERAFRGRQIYDAHCAGCHGRYDANVATPEHLIYPGTITSAAEVGTDPMRARFPAAFGRRIRAIMHETYTSSGGYVAPPLTAIWAQAPYLHNGSVPNLAQLLDPPRRVVRYAFPADPNDPQDFDQIEVGWRIESVKAGPRGSGSRIFDPSLVPGLGNQGHTYGAELESDERADLIEFLKTL